MYRSVAHLSSLLKSARSDVRLGALFKIREQLDVKPLKAYFFLGKRLIEDSDNDCRWQAVIIVGEYLRTNPTEVWRVIKRYGHAEDQDLRSAVSTILLEHLLEYQFQKFFPEVEREEVHSLFFADTLSMCSRFGQPKRDWKKIETLLQENKR